DAPSAWTIDSGTKNVRPRLFVAARRRVDRQRFVERDDQQTVGAKCRRRGDDRHPVAEKLVRRDEAARLSIAARMVVSVVTQARRNEIEVRRRRGRLQILLESGERTDVLLAARRVDDRVEVDERV